MADDGKMVISASQIEDFVACNRRWWLKKVAKLPELQRDYFTFGTVLHACIERWMAADQRGRVPSPAPGVLAGQEPGAPVDVFPKGWETAAGRGAIATVTPNEARLIRALFEDAVEKGVLVRRAGVQVEREVLLPVVTGVDLIGYVDWFEPKQTIDHVATDDSSGGRKQTRTTHVLGIPEIHDHKSFGEGSLRYLKQPGPKDEGGADVVIDAPYEKGDGTSPNSVGHNQQLLTYAAATSFLDGYVGPVLVRHNQFPKFKDPKGVRKVHAVVSSKRIAEHWDFVQDTARKMQAVAKVKLWTDTPGPESTDACSSYGGCPFQGICGKRETPAGYTVRVQSQTKQRAASARPNLKLEPKAKRGTSGGSDMDVDIFKRARETKAGGAALAAAKTAAQTPAPAIDPNPTTISETVPAAPAVNSGPSPKQVLVTGGAPWANPTCPSCKGLGMNKDGRPCKICDATAVKRKRPKSEMYVVEITDEGAVAVVRDEHVDAVGALGAPVEWSQSEARAVDAPAAAPAPAPAPTVTTGEAPAAAKVTSVKVAKPTAAPAPAPAEPVVAATAETAPEAPAPEPAKVKKKDGRPTLGITLLLGCVQLRGPTRPTMLAGELMVKVGAEMALDMNAESYFALDQHKRKDRLRQRGEAIAESLGKTVVIFPGGTNDFDLVALFNALEPYAEFVYERLG